MPSPYETLGVSRSASDDEIRRAFRKLAKTCHPDLHPGDKAAERRFKDYNAAHDLLSDKEKRARYDAGEIDENGNERARTYSSAGAGRGPGGFHPGAGAGAGDDFTDLFSDLFGRGARGNARPGRGGGFALKGEDLQAELKVDFLDAANGASKRVQLADGRGFDVSVPPGLADGQSLRLKGKGYPGIGGGEPGDLMVKVSVAPHKLFRREGNDIHCEVAISLPEAVLGGKVPVPTLTGKVSLSVPPGSSGGSTLRLKGKGIKGKGDQLVTLKIVLPEMIDPGLREFLEGWSQRYPYNPRPED